MQSCLSLAAFAPAFRWGTRQLTSVPCRREGQRESDSTTAKVHDRPPPADRLTPSRFPLFSLSVARAELLGDAVETCLRSDDWRKTASGSGLPSQSEFPAESFAATFPPAASARRLLNRYFSRRSSREAVQAVDALQQTESQDSLQTFLASQPFIAADAARVARLFALQARVVELELRSLSTPSSRDVGGISETVYIFPDSPVVRAKQDELLLLRKRAKKLLAIAEYVSTAYKAQSWSLDAQKGEGRPDYRNPRTGSLVLDLLAEFMLQGGVEVVIRMTYSVITGLARVIVHFGV